MTNRSLKIVVLSSWSYQEPLTHSYLLPYVRMLISILPAGSKVWLQTSEKEHLKPGASEMTDIASGLAADGITWMPADYVPFGLRALPNYMRLIWKIRKLVRRERVDYLHPFAPGAGTTALFVKMISSVKIVMDSWEPHAESMIESGIWKKSSLAFKIMWWAEKRLAREAEFLIAASKRMSHYAKEKWNITREDMLYKPACVDLDSMNPQRFDRALDRKNAGLENKVVCICSGKLEGMYMGRESFRFFRSCYDVWGPKFYVLILSQTDPVIIQQFAEEVGFPSENYGLRHVAFSEVPQFLAMSDFAFNPVKPMPSKQYCTPVKDGEYWAMGLPVLLQDNVSEDSDVVKTENVGCILGDMSHEDNLRVITQMKSLLVDPETPKRCRSAAMRYRSFDLAMNAYRKIYLK